MAEVREIFTQLIEARLTCSQTEFSTLWLSRSPRYYSHLVATDREPGLATLIALEMRLRRVAAATSSKGDRDLPDELSSGMRANIEARSITDIRRHRPRVAGRRLLVERRRSAS